MNIPSQRDILGITDELNYIVREFTDENIDRKQALVLIKNLKNEAAKLNVPFVLDKPEALLDKVASSRQKPADLEDFDDFSEEYSEYSESEYSEDE